MQIVVGKKRWLVVAPAAEEQATKMSQNSGL